MNEEIPPEHPDEVGTVVDPSQLAAMALLARGLHPCIVELDEHGREVNFRKWRRKPLGGDGASGLSRRSVGRLLVKIGLAPA